MEDNVLQFLKKIEQACVHSQRMVWKRNSRRAMREYGITNQKNSAACPCMRIQCSVSAYMSQINCPNSIFISHYFQRMLGMGQTSRSEVSIFCNVTNRVSSSSDAVQLADHEVHMTLCD